MTYVGWHPLLTDHQAHTYAALREVTGERVMVNVGRMNDAVREAQGWVRRSTGVVEETPIPASGWRRWARAELDRYPDATHVFGSPFESPRQIVIMATACRLGRRVVIISEPFSTQRVGYLSDRRGGMAWLKGCLRPAVYWAYGAYFARRLDAVFAISPLACRQFAAMGVGRERLFPFGYFVPAADVQAAWAASCGQLRLVFVGSLIARKGLVLAIAAVRALRRERQEVTLDVYGAGDLGDFDWGEGVDYRGLAPFGGAGAVIAGYDALVLPSLFDGWGVVVNEALQAGTPVCCSNAVGAGAVVESYSAGAMFASGDASDLARVLRDWIQEPARLAAARAGARAAALALSPAVAAAYLHAAMKSLGGINARPISPWYSWQTE